MPRALLTALLILLAIAASTYAAAEEPPKLPTFTDATPARLVADAAVGAKDSSEKDYAAGDLDRDGDLDVVVARRIGINDNEGRPLPNTLLMNEDGVLTDRTAALAKALLESARSRDVIVVDVNHDGWLDVIVGDGIADRPKLLLNRGEDAGVWQGLAPGQGMPAIDLDVWTLAAGDLTGDGDGYPDLFLGVRAGNDRIYVNRGAVDGAWGGFADDTTARLGGNGVTTAVRSSAIVDIDGDGDLDILEDITAGTGATRILVNDGAGAFTGAHQDVITGAAYNFATGDLDGDGDLDVVGVRNGLDQYRLNEGTGTGNEVTFADAVDLPNSNGYGSIARLADLNGDGALDVLICDRDQEYPEDCSRRLRIFYNTRGAPLFIEGRPDGAAWLRSGTSDVLPIDLDGDGDLDLLVGHCEGQSVYMQE